MSATSPMGELTFYGYFQRSMFVLLVYDYLLTFPQEVERIWKQNFTIPMLLFALNRYMTFLYWVVAMLVCSVLKRPVEYDGVFTNLDANGLKLYVSMYYLEASMAIFIITVCELAMIIRTYALYGCHRFVLAFLLFILVAQLGLCGYFIFQPFLGADFESLDHNLSNPYVFWITSLVIDSCIIILTMWKSYGLFKSSGDTPLLHIFFRDGIIYFLVACICNVFNIVLFFLIYGVSNMQFNVIMTSLMVSRLVLNIRTNLSPEDSYGWFANSTQSESRISTLIIGNLGGEMDSLFDYREESASDGQLQSQEQ